MESFPSPMALRAQLVTLSFLPDHGGFDDAPLNALLAGKQVLAIRDHLFTFQDVPRLACLVTYLAIPPAPEPAHRVPARPTRDILQGLSPGDREIAQRLRHWRVMRARKDGVPPYVLFTNRELLAIVSTKPASIAALRRIEGVGPKKAEHYGVELLRLLHGTAAEPQDAEAAS